MSYQTFFERYEFKYWVPETFARWLTVFIDPYMKLDLFGKQTTPQSRQVTLYLETPDLTFFDRHVEGDSDRFKLRIRRYGDPVDGPAFFEIKRKVKNVVVKRRAAVPVEWMRPLLDGSYSDLPRLASVKERATLEQFLYYKTIYGAEPKVLIACNREAYRSRESALDVRLTMDRAIRYQTVHGCGGEVDPKAWVAVGCEREHGREAPQVMLELKFRGIAPAWMAELVQRLDLYRTAFSKYTSAIQFEEFERYLDVDWQREPALPLDRQEEDVRLPLWSVLQLKGR
jgi:hypothetical protein